MTFAPIAAWMAVNLPDPVDCSPLAPHDALTKPQARLLEVTKALPGKADELVGIHTGFPHRTWQINSQDYEMRVQEVRLAGKVTA